VTTSSTQRNTRLYRQLGCAGLVPFVFCAAIVLLSDTPETRAWGLNALLSYAAVVAAFIGAVHWGVWLTESPDSRPTRLGWGVAPSIASWILLLLPASWALAGFILLYATMAVVDLLFLRGEHPGYGTLRRNLSLGVLSCLALATPFALGLAG